MRLRPPFVERARDDLMFSEHSINVGVFKDGLDFVGQNAFLGQLLPNSTCPREDRPLVGR